jgi:ketosteroid isomerase-like protein
MHDERIISDLHTRWLFGWERNEGDTPFDFRRVFGELYDDASDDVRLYDDFDPGKRVATTPAQYGAIWEPNFHRMRYAHHAVDDGPHVIAGRDLSASNLTFVARIATADAVTDIRTVTSLVWRRTPDGWRIVREHNTTTVLPPGHLDGALRATRPGDDRDDRQGGTS